MKVVENLSTWFDENARRRSIPMDLKHQKGFVAIMDSEVIGFLTLYVAEGRLHIGWLGVRKDIQRQGVGRALLSRAEDMARRRLGIVEIATYTLGDSVEYEPYELTRSFYFKNGFRVYQRNQTDNPGCPEEIRISKMVLNKTDADGTH